MSGDHRGKLNLRDEIMEMVRGFSGSVGIAVRHLGTGDEVFINERARFYAASTIKVGILIEAFRQAEAGLIDFQRKVPLRNEDKVGGAGVLRELHEGLELTIYDLAVLMTVISDNTASNMLIDILGFDNINRTLHEMGALHSVLEKKFMVEVPGKSNVTTPLDMLEIFSRIAMGKAISQRASEEIREVLLRQQYNEKIPLFLPRGTPVAHKTGSFPKGGLPAVSHDAGIVYAPGGPYIFCMFTGDLEDERDGDALIAKVSKVVYDYFVSFFPFPPHTHYSRV